ncbi:MAG: T9SS type A sorting domain-containing protein [Bacteroidota bacterium]
MKNLASFLLILFWFTIFSYSQNTFWIVKGGAGDEVGNYRSAHLDTTAGGNLLWLYNTTSTPSGSEDIVMEVWPKGGNSPQAELFLGYPNHIRLNNLQRYQDQLYLSTAMVNPAVSSNTRAGLIRLDTNGVYISSFMHDGSQMGNYGNAYQCVFLQDTTFLFGQARSSAGSGNREDFYWAKLDLNTNSSLAAKRWNGFGTERIRDALASQTGDSIFAAAYSYSSSSNTRPVWFHFDKQGNIVQQYYYLMPAPTWGNYYGSFFEIDRRGTDSLVAIGKIGLHDIIRVPMGMDGQAGPSVRYSSSNSGVGIRIHGTQSYGNQLLLYGYLDNESMGSGGEEGFLMSLDAQGNVLWAKMYGGSGDEQITDLQVTTDGFYLTGKTNTSGQGGWDAMLLKTDLNGNISQLSPCFSIIPYTAFVNTSALVITRTSLSVANSGALTAHSGPSMSSIPSSNIFDDNCNVLGWQSEENPEDEVPLFKEAGFKVFPNPFRERLNIELDGPADQLEVALVDQFGRLVHQEHAGLLGESTYECSLPQLTSGVYILQVKAYHKGKMKRYQTSLLHR